MEFQDTLRIRTHSSTKNPSILSRGSSATEKITFERVKVDKISKRTFFENLNYKFDVLVPTNEETEVLVPSDSYLQQVRYDNFSRWRTLRDETRHLPAYLADVRERKTVYHVISESRGFFKPLNLGSPFIKQWDKLVLVLLLFTASVTPFETAYVMITRFLSESPVTDFTMLFLVNRFVDIVFFIDIFINMRLPFRHHRTGNLVLDQKAIITRYLKSWFMIDLLSILPFEFIALTVTSRGQDLEKLQLLRFIRLTKLLKLLRVFRAKRKLKQVKIASGLRFVTLELLKVIISN